MLDNKFKKLRVGIIDLQVSNIHSVLDPGDVNDYSKVIKKVKEVFWKLPI